MVNQFDERREEFKPYGFTCELWMPGLMTKPDRHNEIEINYFTEGSMTYLFQDERITVPAKRLTVFWAMVPHQIIQYKGDAPYYVCTIPFSQFLDWKLSSSFVDRLLKGEILFEPSEHFANYDEFLFQNWIADMKLKNTVEVTLQEVRARLGRLASAHLPQHAGKRSAMHLKESSQVERIAIYIARNYSRSIKVADIGEAVGLHPDYANAIFKKAFACTLSEYIIEERIGHVQRELVATNNSITNIAFQCGFNSISRFNAAFLKINGCTPREFRKRYR